MRVFLDLRRGEITRSSLSMTADSTTSHEEDDDDSHDFLKGRQLHHFQKWKDIIEEAGLDASTEGTAAICSWLDSVLPTRIQTGEVA